MVPLEGFVQKDMTFPRNGAFLKVSSSSRSQGEFLAQDSAALLFPGRSLVVQGRLRLLPVALASIHGYRRTLCNGQIRLCFCSLDLSPARSPPRPSFP